MQIEDIEELRKAASLMCQVRCILEGIYDSLDPMDDMRECIEFMASDANVLEDELDHLVGSIRKD